MNVQFTIEQDQESIPSMHIWISYHYIINYLQVWYYIGRQTLTNPMILSISSCDNDGGHEPLVFIKASSSRVRCRNLHESRWQP